MRIATFNLKSLDLPPKPHAGIEVRAEVFQPPLARLDADVMYLQEVNAKVDRSLRLYHAAVAAEFNLAPA